MFRFKKQGLLTQTRNFNANQHLISISINNHHLSNSSSRTSIRGFRNTKSNDNLNKFENNMSMGMNITMKIPIQRYYSNGNYWNKFLNSEHNSNKIVNKLKIIPSRNVFQTNMMMQNILKSTQNLHFSKRSMYTSTSPQGGGTGGPFKSFNDRLYNYIADLEYQYGNTGFIPYVEGDRESTLALFYLILAQIIIYFLVGFIFPQLESHFSISKQSIYEKKYHVIFTHSLYHGNLLHLLINSYVLISISKSLMNASGLRPIATVYLAGVVSGGLLTSWTISLENHFYHKAMGSSTGIFALFTYAALLNPHLRAGIILLPFTFSIIQLWYFAIFFEIFRLFAFQTPSASGHLGGAIGGALAVLLRV